MASSIVGRAVMVGFVVISVGGRAVAETRWIENRGQLPAHVQFMSEVAGGLVAAEAGAIGMLVRGERASTYVRLSFEGASTEARWTGRELLEGVHHYYLGDDPRNWVRSAPAFASVANFELHPGIDVGLAVREGRVKYDLFVDAGADLSKLRLRVEGAESIHLDEHGQVELDTAQGRVRQSLGAAWEVLPDGSKRPIEWSWRLLGQGRLGIECPARDPALPLVIDPELTWSTYLGSTSAAANGDLQGRIARSATEVVTVGRTNGLDFPQTPGTVQNPHADASNAIVTKFRAADGALIFSSMMGSSGSEAGVDVALDDLGNVHVVGWTDGPDFPVTRGAFDSQRSGFQQAGFVLKLSTAGDELVYATYLESIPFSAVMAAVAIDSMGRAVVAGYAGTGFPTTAGTFDPVGSGGQDAVVVCLDPTGSALEWSTYLGGSNGEFLQDMAIASDDSLVITGETASTDYPTTPGAYLEQPLVISTWFAFITRITPDGSSLIWSSLLGGTEIQHTTSGRCVAIDAMGYVTVAGASFTPTFPTTPGAFQEDAPLGQNGGSFLTRFQLDGSGLIYSTFFGGPGGTSLWDIVLDPSGAPTITGQSGAGMPVTPGSYDQTHSGSGTNDLFLARLTPHGDRLLYSTYIGGPSNESGRGLAMSDGVRVSISGSCFAPGGYPTTPGALFPDFLGGNTDIVVTTLDLLLQGVEVFGESIPSCLGAVRIDATRMPVAGDASFSVYASGAPPNASGWLVVSNAYRGLNDATGTHAGLLLDPKQSTRIQVQSDTFGWAEATYPLPSDSAGDTLYFQFLFENPPGCTTSEPRSASHGLTVTVQP